MNHDLKHRLQSRRYMRNSKLLKLAFFAVIALVAFPIAALMGHFGLTPAVHEFGGPGVITMCALGLTLTRTELLLLQIQAFRKRVPALAMMGTDFGDVNLKYKQQAIARIASLPTASTYGTGGLTGTGYANGVQSGRGLLTDVPIMMDQWGTVPILLEHLNHIQDQINDYTSVVASGGYVLAKQVVDYALKLVNFSRFSQSLTFAVTDCDVDMLIKAGETMNQVTESNDRYMLVNSQVASTLAADQRLINSQYFGEKQDGEAIRVFRNCFGFREIREYPDMPLGTTTPFAVTGVNSTGVLTQTAHGLSVGDRWKLATLSSGGSSLSAGTFYFVKTVIDANTFTISATRGGSTQALGSDVATATGGRATNLVAFAFERRAFAIKSGAPDAAPTEALAAQFGIPQVTNIQSMIDQETKTAMGMASFQHGPTGDLYVVPNVIYGARVGTDLGGSAGALTDYAGLMIISA